MDDDGLETIQAHALTRKARPVTVRLQGESLQEVSLQGVRVLDHLFKDTDPLIWFKDSDPLIEPMIRPLDHNEYQFSPGHLHRLLLVASCGS
jgi:hypothetical protein